MWLRADGVAQGSRIAQYGRKQNATQKKGFHIRSRLVEDGGEIDSNTVPWKLFIAPAAIAMMSKKYLKLTMIPTGIAAT